jgi:glycerol uptake facilitator-like aquaporin
MYNAAQKLFAEFIRTFLFVLIGAGSCPFDPSHQS